MTISDLQEDLVRLPSGTLWFPSAPQTYVDALRSAVERHPDAPALVGPDGTTVGYAELWERSSRIAGGLRDTGLRDGDRVGLDLADGVVWVEVFLGTLLAGGVPVPLDQRATDAARRAVVQDAEARLVVDGPDAVPVAQPLVHDVAPESLGLLLYTSGTTGAPKGVMLSHRNLASFGEIERRLFGLRTDELMRSLVTIPLCHSAGCNGQLLPTLALGGVAILTGSTKTQTIMDVAERTEPDTMMAVPAIYQLLAMREAERLARLTSLRRVMYGAAATPTSLIDRLRELLPQAELGNAFGMTEIAGIATYRRHDPADSRKGGIGRPVPGVEIELRGADESGHGELYLRGPNMAQGYWRRPEQTQATFGTGWVRSGDIAAVDADGQIFLRDRVGEVINRGGEKIFPAVVEDAILGCPGIAEAAVLPVPDEVMGQKVGAVVVVARGASRSAAGIRAELAGRVPGHAIPEYLVIREEPLPRGTSGKVLKPHLRKELGWDRVTA